MTAPPRASERLSARSADIEASGIRRMFELTATMRDPINLSIGQAHFDPPAEMVEAAVAALRGNRANRYSVTEGIPELNAAVADYIERQGGRRPEATLVTCGVSGGLMLSFLTALNPGEEILIPDPYFVMYKHLASMLGIVPVSYDTYPEFRIDAARIAERITERTRVILINSPQNPTGALVGQDELEGVAALAREHDLLVVSDEIYAEFVYDEPFHSMFPLYESTVVLGGFSKTYGVPGWRLGYAAGPEVLIDKMRTLQQFTFVCAPVPLQHAAVRALEIDMGAEIGAYRRKRDMVYEGLRERFSIARPGGSFYAFPAYPEGVDPKAFLARAIEEKVLIVPGGAFSERDTHFRVSFALEDDKLARGIEILNAIAAELG
jgi:aspartate aminotransferase/aminotransferase